MPASTPANTLPPEATVLHAEKISFSYPNCPAIFSDITISLKRGDRIALLGPSGCGKSTLLRILGGILKPKQGRVLLQRDDGQESRTGFMFQSPVLLPWCSVGDNIALSARLSGQDRSIETVRGWCKSVGLEGLENRQPISLSGGQRQRAALARALATYPDILLLDEPFAALDKDRRDHLVGLVDRLARSHNIAVILVTHDATEAGRLADCRYDFTESRTLQESEWWRSEAI